MMNTKLLSYASSYSPFTPFSASFEALRPPTPPPLNVLCSDSPLVGLRNRKKKQQPAQNMRNMSIYQMLYIIPEQTETHQFVPKKN